MASSNRHWPSMFKSKPTHHHWHHDFSSSLLSSTASHTNPYTTSVGVCEERTPEPKPRWNPRPEQIRILETIFNSGMVNPPRDEIRKIRTELQEYGQVGDANVFYWFQNRKSRTKHKHRHSSTTKPSTSTAAAAPASSSSSSDKSSPNKSTENSLSAATVIDLLNSHTGSVNQPGLLHPQTNFLSEPAVFSPVQQNSTAPALDQGFWFPDVTSTSVSTDDQSIVPSFILSELNPSKKTGEDDQAFSTVSQNTITTPAVGDHSILPSIITPTTHNIFQGVPEVPCPARSLPTVYINDLCFEVGDGPFNVRDAFGDDVVLVQSTGQPVMMDEWGVTLQPLQHGACYYLMTASTVALPPDYGRTFIDLI